MIFHWNGVDIRGGPGDRFLDLLDDVEGHALPIACRGGNCGTCRVAVTEGLCELEPPSAAERSILAGCAAGPDERLACQICVRRDPVGDRIRLKRV